ncbi:hypothetical protein [Candidatus Finniella inopinata]|uniref:HEAT repeat domain-containing protein n=1 Tax=Candidatus Finniella inopinata TaxID=1696036 RepID=A0A4Q7DJQ5_9PROT|nr:hypothetical protein [Candidatus Finniella inopinata]RZI46590.1 hypothetical protein EQU50_03110 [Candidatus Finniella inopinata]
MKFNKKIFKIAFFSLVLWTTLAQNAFSADTNQNDINNATLGSNTSNSSIPTPVTSPTIQEPSLSLTDFSAGLSALSSPGSTSVSVSQENICQSCATGSLCAHAKRDLASAPSQFETVDQETQILALKTLLRFSTETIALPTGAKLFDIAKTISCSIKKAELLGYLMARGCVDVRRQAADALTYILSGGNSNICTADILNSSKILDDCQDIPLDIRLAAANAALEEAINKNSLNNNEIPMTSNLRRTIAAPEPFISQIVVKCLYKAPTTSPLITLFSRAANDLRGDEYFLSDLARRILGQAYL